MKGFAQISHPADFSAEGLCLHAEDPGRCSRASPLIPLLLKCIRGALFLQVWKSRHACIANQAVVHNQNLPRDRFICFISVVLLIRVSYWTSKSLVAES